MRLSEAIRLGAMLKPQAFGTFRARTATRDDGAFLGLRIIESTCALGAACDAGYKRSGIDQVHVWCPACSLRAGVLFHAMHLNDTHRWTREQIADWVESIELQQAVNAEATTPQAVEGSPVRA